MNFVPPVGLAYEFAQLSPETANTCWIPAVGPQPALALMDALAARDARPVQAVQDQVETEAELNCLRKEGCHEGQGFLFSRARPNSEIVGLLKTQGNWSSPAGAALVA